MLLYETMLVFEDDEDEDEDEDDDVDRMRMMMRRLFVHTYASLPPLVGWT